MIGAATSGIVSPLARSYKQGEVHGIADTTSFHEGEYILVHALPNYNSSS
jgi:hypothetical protein